MNYGINLCEDMKEINMENISFFFKKKILVLFSEYL